jgi:hypothetical protein
MAVGGRGTIDPVSDHNRAMSDHRATRLETGPETVNATKTIPQQNAARRSTAGAGRLVSQRIQHPDQLIEIKIILESLQTLRF